MPWRGWADRTKLPKALKRASQIDPDNDAPQGGLDLAQGSTAFPDGKWQPSDTHRRAAGHRRCPCGPSSSTSSCSPPPNSRRHAVSRSACPGRDTAGRRSPDHGPTWTSCRRGIAANPPCTDNAHRGSGRSPASPAAPRDRVLGVLPGLGDGLIFCPLPHDLEEFVEVFPFGSCRNRLEPLLLQDLRPADGPGDEEAEPCRAPVSCREIFVHRSVENAEEADQHSSNFDPHSPKAAARQDPPSRAAPRLERRILNRLRIAQVSC